MACQEKRECLCHAHWKGTEGTPTIDRHESLVVELATMSDSAPSLGEHPKVETVKTSVSTILRSLGTLLRLLDFVGDSIRQGPHPVYGEF